MDFDKHVPPQDIPKVVAIWESIPRHLAHEHKKFVFSALAKSARARDYENALQWLIDASLVHRCRGIEHIEMPLSAFTDPDAFKVYALDVGLLVVVNGRVIPLEMKAGINPRSKSLSTYGTGLTAGLCKNACTDLY